MELEFPFLSVCIGITTHLLSDNCVFLLWPCLSAEVIRALGKTAENVPLYTLSPNFNMFCLKKTRKSADEPEIPCECLFPLSLLDHGPSTLLLGDVIPWQRVCCERGRCAKRAEAPRVGVRSEAFVTRGPSQIQLGNPADPLQPRPVSMQQRARQDAVLPNFWGSGRGITGSVAMETWSSLK